MNKKLLALAIGAAVAMPVAALADGPTLYGKINVSLESVDDEIGNDSDLMTSGTETDGWVVRDNASRIGIKGAVETGVDGLKGLYLAEYGIQADSGFEQLNVDDPSPFSQRNIYVGLQGDFGTVLLGNLDTPLKSAQGKVDQFNDTTVDMGNFVAGELRAPNVVAYASPKLADAVTVTVALWEGEGWEVDAANPERVNGLGDAVSASVVYEKDSLYLALAMDKETPSTGGVDLSGFTIDDIVNANPLSINDVTRIVAAYTTDTFEVGALYQIAEGADTASNDEDTTVLLSGAYKTGDWKFKGQYVMTEGDASGDEATMMGLGADYALGKATTAYAFYASEEYDNGTSADERTVLALGLEQRF